MIRKTKSSGYLFLIVLLSLLLATTALARDGVITVHYAVDKHTKPVSGAVFSIVRIMDYEKGVYHVCEQVMEKGITEEDILQHTKLTAVSLSEKMKADSTQKTDKKGVANFSGLTEGVYLIWQSGKDEAALKYENASPTIVMIPTKDKDGDNYCQTIYPKTTRLHREPNTEETENKKSSIVRTGDTINIRGWMLLMLSAVFSILAILLWKRRGEYEEGEI